VHSPAHECDACHEDDEARGEVIGCRRCPKAYHRGCLPDALFNAPKRRVWISNRELGACALFFFRLLPSSSSSPSSGPC
jgi:hypothetical protein